MKKVQPEEGQSADMVADNIERLKELFPEAFSEDGVDFDVLRQLLGDASVLNKGEEKYGLNWHGKKKPARSHLRLQQGRYCLAPRKVLIGIRRIICLLKETILRF